jgi:hypothetical protein
VTIPCTQHLIERDLMKRRISDLTDQTSAEDVLTVQCSTSTNSSESVILPMEIWRHRILEYTTFENLVLKFVNKSFNEMIIMPHNEKMKNLVIDLQRNAVESGSLAMLKWLKTLGWHKSSGLSCETAARCGHFHLLKWLTKNGHFLGTSLYFASAQGNYEAVYWILGQSDYKNPPWFHITWYAAAYGQIEFLKKLHDDGIVFSKDITNKAVESGRSDLVLWLLGLNYSYDNVLLMCTAVKYNKIEIIKLIMDMNPTFDFKKNTCFCIEAAIEGNLSTLQWLRKQGFSWDSKTTYHAVTRANWDVFKWAIKHGCDLNDGTLGYLIDRNNLAMLDYVIKSGRSYKKNTLLMIAMESGYEQSQEIMCYIEALQ